MKISKTHMNGELYLEFRQGFLNNTSWNIASFAYASCDMIQVCRSVKYSWKNLYRIKGRRRCKWWEGVEE